MAYGHSTLFFLNADEARSYLDSCARSGNYTAENYQDRVAAQNCIRRAENWRPVPLPPPSTADIPLKKRPSRQNRKQPR